jgi:hypothetical protein
MQILSCIEQRLDTNPYKMVARGKPEEHHARLDRTEGELPGGVQGEDVDWDTPANIKSFFVLEFEEEHCDDMLHDEAEDWQVC